MMPSERWYILALAVREAEMPAAGKAAQQPTRFDKTSHPNYNTGTQGEQKRPLICLRGRFPPFSV